MQLLARALVLVLTLAACSDGPGIGYLPDATPQSLQTVFVATMRAPDEATPFSFTGDRSEALSFLRYDLSIPPGHRAGNIEWPRGTPDPATDFVVVNWQRYDGQGDFNRAIQRRSRTASEDPLIFVHGYNTNYAEGIYRAAQVSHDFEAPGPVILFSWASAGEPVGYGYDRDSILIARDGLEEVLNGFDRGGLRRVDLAGHSMGAQLVMETLRQMAIRRSPVLRRTVDGIVLVAPDIDIDTFISQTDSIRLLPDPFMIFVARNDRALRVSAGITGFTERLGSISDIEKLAALNVTVVETSNLGKSSGLNHSIIATSEEGIRALRQMIRQRQGTGNQQFSGNVLVDGLTVINNAVQIVLGPVGDALSDTP